MAQATSDVAISKHLPLFAQTRQGFEKKMMMEEYDNPLPWRLWTCGPEGIVAVKGTKNTAVTPGIPYQNRICEHPDVLV
jgi:hypothetical protein